MPIAEDTTFLVYRERRPGREVLSHLPGPNPGTPYTLCGLDAGDMERHQHHALNAAVWCTRCFGHTMGPGGGSFA